MSLYSEWYRRAEAAVDAYYAEHPPERRYVIEYKRAPEFLRAHGFFVHGIDTPRWERITKTVDDLFIWELQRSKDMGLSPLLLYQSVAVLDGAWDNTVPPHAVVGYPDGMRQWKREAFTIIGMPELHEQWWRRTCIIPGCNEAVPTGRSDRLCDEHYAPVSDEAVARQIAWAMHRK